MSADEFTTAPSETMKAVSKSAIFHADKPGKLFHVLHFTPRVMYPDPETITITILPAAKP